MFYAVQEPVLARNTAFSRSLAVWSLKSYIYLVAFTLTIDWFYPTGALLREFGAKPATPLLAAGGMVGCVFVRRRSVTLARFEQYVIAFFGTLVLLGALAFLINLSAGWSSFSLSKNPITQFLAQSALIVIAGVSVVGNARIGTRFPFVISTFKQAVPIAAGLHLFVWWLEVTQHASDSWLLLFKSVGGAVDRASGLHSEPSYYGTMAALFAFALFLLPVRGGQRVFYWILGLLLMVSAVSVTAKTFVVVSGVQGAFVLMATKLGRIARLGVAFVFLLTITATYYFAQNNAALSVEQNLSTAVRFGSTHLAVNAALDGYGLLGIGTGQFHFFFDERFAPDYLLFSDEAIEQMQPNADTRASTYNLYVRVLLETGLLGFLLLMWSVGSILRLKLPPEGNFLSVMFVGSLAFLLTQDTYFYPPLVLTAALILAARSTFVDSAS